MSNIVLWGFPNHTAQAYATPSTVSGSVEPADMGAAWLKTDEPSEVARITTLDPYYTMWGTDTKILPLTVDGLALVNHNVADGGQIRFVGWGGGVIGVHNLPTVAAPQTIVASTNRTGAVGDIDEAILSPDGSRMGPAITGLSWSVTLRFSSLAGTIHPGDDMMAIVIRVRRVFSGADDPSLLPVVTATLKAPEFELGSRAVTVSATGGQVLIFPFKRSDFTSVADCQVQFFFTAGQSLSTGTPHYAVLETAACYYDAVTANSPTHDSGWLTVESNSRLARVAPTRHLHYIPSAPWTNIIAYGVQVRSDQTIHDLLLTVGGGVVPAAAVPSDPVAFIQAGGFPVGQAIIPALGVRHGRGPMAGFPEAVAVEGASAGGQSYGADAYAYRAIPPLQLVVTRDELLLLQDQLGFRKGRSQPFYVAVEPGVAQKYQLFSAGWVTLASMTAPQPFGRYKADGTMKFLVDVSFVERL